MSALRAADGCLLWDADRQMTRCVEYFEQLSTVDSSSGQFQTAGLQTLDADPPVDETVSSIDDVKEAVANLRGRKAAGIFNISAEHLRACSSTLLQSALKYTILTFSVCLERRLFHFCTYHSFTYHFIRSTYTSHTNQHTH